MSNKEKYDEINKRHREQTIRLNQWITEKAIFGRSYLPISGECVGSPGGFHNILCYGRIGGKGMDGQSLYVVLKSRDYPGNYTNIFTYENFVEYMEEYIPAEPSSDYCYVKKLSVNSNSKPE